MCVQQEHNSGLTLIYDTLQIHTNHGALNCTVLTYYSHPAKWFTGRILTADIFQQVLQENLCNSD